MKETAAGLAALGRGPDSMLVHMSPREVAGLQSLALAHGGSLTVNPRTGLPEAGFLDSLLPAVLGIGATILSGGAITPLMAGLGIGGIQAIRTGDLGKGLMAGLGGFGGASLGGMLGGMGSTAGATAAQSVGAAGNQAANLGLQAGTGAGFAGGASGAGAAGIADVAGAGLAGGASGAGIAGGAVGGELATAAPGVLDKSLAWVQANPMQAGALGLGALGAMGGLETPELGAVPQQRSNAQLSGPVRRPYDESAPEGYYFTDRGIVRPSYASGGVTSHVPQLEDGGFVLTKRAVDGLGGGSNDRGQRVAAAGLGALPIRGPGTGTSDSIPTTIDGDKPALVSNGEAYVPKRQVAKRGGSKKFYALMRAAERRAQQA